MLAMQENQCLARIQWREAEPRVLGGVGAPILGGVHLGGAGEGLWWAEAAGVGQQPCRQCWGWSISPLVIVLQIHQTPSTTVYFVFPQGNRSPLSIPSTSLATHLKHRFHSSWYYSQLFIICWVLSFLRLGMLFYSSPVFEPCRSKCLVGICWISEWMIHESVNCLVNIYGLCTVRGFWQSSPFSGLEALYQSPPYQETALLCSLIVS